MWSPGLGYAIALFLCLGLNSAEITNKELLDGHNQVVQDWDNFFSTWDRSRQPTINPELLQERRQTNLSFYERPNHPIPYSNSKLYPVNLNSGSTECWVPGYTGAHCEFPICSSYNRHDNKANPKVVGIDYQYFNQSNIPTWFSVDYSIVTLIVTLRVDTWNSPQGMLFNEFGGFLNYSESTNDNKQVVYAYYNIQPGYYYVVPYSAQNNNTGMLIAVSGVSGLLGDRSSLSIDVGFNQNTGNNQPERSDFPSSYAWMYSLTVVVADGVGLKIPGSLSTVTIYSQNTELSIPSQMRVRYGCQYQYFFDSFYCMQEGKYYARFEGYDQYGYSFTRWDNFTCLPNTPPPPPPTTPNPNVTCPTGCVNNGVFYKLAQPDSNNCTMTCYCQGLWTGPTCAVPLCANGGMMMGDGICDCQGGWSGTHCDQLNCADSVEYVEGDPMLMMSIRQRQSLGPVIAQIRDQMPLIYNNLNNGQNYLRNWGFSFFNNGQLKSANGQLFSDLGTVVNLLNITSQTPDKTGGCRDNVFQGLADLVNYQRNKKSPIYVLTDALPNDYDQYRDIVYAANAQTNAPINFIYVETDPTNCPTDKFDRGFKEMYDMADRTGGMLHFVQNSDIARVGNLFYSLMDASFYKSHLMYSNDEDVCANQPLYSTISIERGASTPPWKLYFIVMGENITLNVRDPTGRPVNFTLTYNVGASHVFYHIGVISGTWTFWVNSGVSNSPCSIRAWLLESPANLDYLDSDYLLQWGFTDSLFHNDPFPDPYIGGPGWVVAHISNYPNRTNPQVLSPEFVNAELTIHAKTRSGRQLVLATNGQWRSGCSYNLMFPITNSFTCQTPYQLLYLTIYVKESTGYTIQRAGQMYCHPYTPLPTAPPGTCANSGIYQNGTCICPPDWTGKQCEVPICYNGGTFEAFPYNKCVGCSAGWTGAHCEFPMCLQTNTQDFGTTGRSLAFLLDISGFNKMGLNYLAMNIKNVMLAISLQNKLWIENVYVYGFDNTGVKQYTSSLPWDEDAIQAAFVQATTDATKNQPSITACRVQTYQAMQAVMSFLAPNSLIYVYQTALPDDESIDLVANVSYSIEQNRHMLMFYQAQDNDNTIQIGPNGCPAYAIDWDLLGEIAELSQGRFFYIHSNLFGQTLKLVPSMYSSGVVYRRYWYDCSKAQTVFAPLDAYAQSMQIVIHTELNQNVSWTINRPDGTVYQTSMIQTVLQDLTNGYTILDVRKQCDDGWENNNKQDMPYCFKIGGLDAANWTQAQQICNSMDGIVVDDSSKDIDDFLNIWSNGVTFWIGLNDRNATGQFYWDRGPYMTPAPANFTLYHHWASGVNQSDPNNRCAYRGADNKWHLGNCGTDVYHVICMKYKYNDEWEPNTMDTIDLPAGRYAITLSNTTGNTVNGTGACSVEVKVQSPMQIYTAYAQDPLNDNIGLPFNGVSPLVNSTSNRLITRVTQFDPAKKYEPFLTGAQILDQYNNMTMYSAVTYDYRMDCQYQFYSQNFSCPYAGELFSVVHFGKDTKGLPFQRMVNGRCAKQQFCGYQGLLINGKCFCSEYRSGPNCTTPICANGGTAMPDNSCKCPYGYGGEFCQYLYCPKPVNTSFTWNQKTFMLVVEKTAQNQGAMDSIRASIGDIVGSLSKSGWFQNYVLVTFDSTGVLHAKGANNTPDYTSIVNTTLTNPTDNTGTCNLPVFEALIKAANVLPVGPGSIQYLITTGHSNTSDIVFAYQNYLDVIASNNIKLFYIMTKIPPPTPAPTTKKEDENAVGMPSADNGCTNNPMDKLVNPLVEYAVFSDGDFLLMDQKAVGTHARYYLNTLANSTVIGNPAFQNYTCENMNYYFDVDYHAKEIYISAYIPTQGYATNLTIISAKGDPINVIEIYHDNSAHYLFSAIPQGSGLYQLRVDDKSGPCWLQIRTYNGLSFNVGYLGTTGLNVSYVDILDNAQPVPPDTTNVMLVHTGGERVRLTYGLVYYPQTGFEMIFNFYQRYGCSYQFVSDPWDCNSRGVLIGLYGYDAHGTPFRRLSYTFCGKKFATTPTTALPQTTASGGGGTGNPASQGQTSQTTQAGPAGSTAQSAGPPGTTNSGAPAPPGSGSPSPFPSTQKQGPGGSGAVQNTAALGLIVSVLYVLFN